METEAGLVAAGEGWFVLNAREARWRRAEGMGAGMRLEGDTQFPQVGIGIRLLWPDEPMAMYHWETDQEDFLVLSGEALLIVEGEERPLRQWDFVHCPAETKHVIVGAGDSPCTVLAVGAREHHTVRLPDGTVGGAPDWGAGGRKTAVVPTLTGLDPSSFDRCRRVSADRMRAVQILAGAL